MKKIYDDPTMFRLLKTLGADIVDCEINEDVDYFVGLPMSGFSEYLDLAEDEYAFGIYTEKRNFKQWEILFFRPIKEELPNGVARWTSVGIDTESGIGHILGQDNFQFEPISKLIVYQKEYVTRFITKDYEEGYMVNSYDLDKMSLDDEDYPVEISENSLRIPKTVKNNLVVRFLEKSRNGV